MTTSTDDIRALRRALVNETGEQNDVVERQIRYIQIGFIILGSAAVSWAQFLDPTPPNQIPWDKILGFGGVLLVLIGSIWCLDKQTKRGVLLRMASAAVDAAEEFILKRSEFQIAVSSVEKEVQRQNELYTIANFWREQIESTIPNPAPLDQTVTKMIATVLPRLLGASGYKSRDIWSISIYEARNSAQGVTLEMVSTRRCPGADSIDQPRVWPDGRGHVGTAYSKEDEVVLIDVQDPNTKASLNTPASLDRATDADLYRSVAAIPIRVTSLDRPWGVAIMTSNRAGQFDNSANSEGWRNAEGARLLAGAVALAASIHIRELKTATRVSRGRKGVSK